MAQENDLKNLSKLSFNTSTRTLDDLKTSALIRIADATEAMSKNYLALENELRLYKKFNADKTERINELRRTISALKGQITRLNNKIKLINAERVCVTTKL